MPKTTQDRLRVYFAYASRDSDIVDIVANVSSRVDLEFVMVEPQFIQPRENIVETIRQAIASSDLVVAIITPRSEANMGVWRECMMAETMMIPLLFFVHESVKSDPFAPWSRYVCEKFGDQQQLASRLSLSLTRFSQRFYSDHVYVSSRLTERSIIDQLKASLKKNVLVRASYFLLIETSHQKN